MSATGYPPLGTRRFGALNGRGLWTLFTKEIRRFAKVWLQTIAAPMVTTLLFFAIFTIAIGPHRGPVDGVPFPVFLAPGLVMMAVIQNAFANTSSSLLISKVQGNVVDILMPPLSPGELTIGFALGGAVRGLAVAAATLAVMMVIAEVRVAHLWAVLFFAGAASLIMSLIGMLAGIWAEKFDHMASVTNFVITPLSFLSGTFYSVRALPEPWSAVSQANPIFYMIDGFRYGFTGQADGSILAGVAILSGLVAALWWAVRAAFARGWKLKA